MTQLHDHGLLKGGIFMSIGFILMAIFGALLKVTSSLSSYIFAVWLAFGTAFGIQFIIGLAYGLNFFYTRHLVKHFFRGFFGVAATLFYVVSLSHMQLMNATLLFNTAPLFVPILTLIFLSEKMNWKIIVSILIGFVGIIFIIKPTKHILSSPWSLIALASGILLAVAFFYVKLLSMTDPLMRVCFYFFFFGTLLLSPFIPFIWEPYNYKVWLWGVATGVVSITAQLLIIKAYQVAHAGPVGVFQYFSVITAGLIDWIFWKITPTLFTYIGTAIVVVSAIAVILSSRSTRTDS